MRQPSVTGVERMLRRFPRGPWRLASCALWRLASCALWRLASCALWLFASYALGPLAGCVEVRSAGSDQRCSSEPCGDASTHELPIGEPVFGPNDPAAYARMAEGIIGDWYGVAAGFEAIAPFAISFARGDKPGTGTFSVYCPESPSCGELGTKEPDGRSSGTYKLIHVSPDNEGQGELSWEGLLSLVQSLTFRSLLLQQDDSVLSFVIDLPLGVVQLVLQRDAWPEAGLPIPMGPPPLSEGDAGAGDDDDADADAGSLDGDAGPDPDVDAAVPEAALRLLGAGKA